MARVFKFRNLLYKALLGMDATDAPEAVRRAAPGPYTLSVLRDFLPSPVRGWFGRHLSFKICVTYANNKELGKLPLAVLINGFQVIDKLFDRLHTFQIRI